MNPKNKTVVWGADRHFAGLVGVGYLLAGLVWIALSDKAGALLFSSAETLTRFQTWKGTGFVLVTSALVYVLAARASRLAEPAPVGRLRAGLRALLAGLVLVTAAPLVILLGYNMVAQTRASVQDANALVQGVASANSAEAQAFLEERERLALLLARRPLVQAVDPAHCDPLLREVPALHEGLRNVAVLDLRGRVVCAAERGAPVAVAAGALPPGGAVFSPPPSPGRDAAFALTYAIRSTAQQTVGGLQLVMAASSLERLLAGDVPLGVTTSFITMQGHLLARRPPVGHRVGEQIPEFASLADALRRGATSLVARGLDGKERFYALRRVGDSELVALAGVEVEHAFGALRSEALRSLGVGAVVLLLASLLIIAIVRRIAAPMKALAKAAEAVANGQFDRRAPETGPREVAGVAEQFNHMLDRLPALERELRDSEERNRTLLDKLSHNIPGVIFQLRVAAGGHAWFPFCSERIERMFEVTPAQAAESASVVLDRIHREDSPLVEAALHASTERTGDVVMEYRVQLPRGGLRHYLTYAQLEPLGACDVLWHGCTVDVTPLKQAQLALRQANELLEVRVAQRTRELAAANESLESFSFSIAHDLRAPLQAIEGFAGALPGLIERGEPPRVQRLVQRIQANTARMGAMVDGLLAVARAGKGHLDERTVAVRDLVDDVLAELALPPAVEVDVAALPVVRADPATLRQVWWNVLANAAKFSARCATPRIAVGFEQRNGELVFSVRDNGAGFDPQFAGRLFTPFQRLHEAHEFEGTGIGLALARRVVERHGGRIGADGRPGQGATFWFSLPAERLVS